MTNDYRSTHPRDSDGDHKSHIAVLKERVDQHHVRIGRHDEDIDDLCERMTKIEVLRASGAKVSWFVASAITAALTSMAGVIIGKLWK